MPVVTPAAGSPALGLDTAFIGHVGDDQLGSWVRAELAGDGIDLTGLGIDPAGHRPQRQPDGLRRLPDQLLRRPRAPEPHRRPGPGRASSSPAAGWRCSTCPIGPGTCCRSPGRPAPSSPAICRTSGIRTTSTCGTSSRARTSCSSPRPTTSIRRRCSSSWSAAAAARWWSAAAAGSASRSPPPTGIRVYPPPRVDLPVVDTNGAGDALAVGFLVAHELEGRPVEEAVQRGQLAAQVDLRAAGQPAATWSPASSSRTWSPRPAAPCSRSDPTRYG